MLPQGYLRGGLKLLRVILVAKYEIYCNFNYIDFFRIDAGAVWDLYIQPWDHKWVGGVCVGGG